MKVVISYIYFTLINCLNNIFLKINISRVSSSFMIMSNLTIYILIGELDQQTQILMQTGYYMN